MPPKHRGVVTPPNEHAFKGDCRTNGFLPLSAGDTPFKALSPSTPLHIEPGGSADLFRRPSPVNPINTLLANGDPGYTLQPDSAIEPGKAAIPVNPFIASGQGFKRVDAITDDSDLRLE